MQPQKERDAIFQEHWGENPDAEPETGKVEAEPEKDQPKDESTPEEQVKSEEAPEEAPKEPETDETPEGDKPDQEEQKNKGDLKVALRKEREKFRDYKKDTGSKITKLESELVGLKETVNTLATAKEDEYDIRTDEEKKLAALEEKITLIEERDKKAEEDGNYQNFLSEIKSIGGELEEEGLPGFKQYGRAIIQQRFLEMSKEDAMKMDHPEGWKEIWREEFPKLAVSIEAYNKEKNFEKKEQNKKDAEMLGESKGLKKSVEEGPLTKEEADKEYFKRRGAPVV